MLYEICLIAGIVYVHIYYIENINALGLGEFTICSKYAHCYSTLRRAVFEKTRAYNVYIYYNKLKFILFVTDL